MVPAVAAGRRGVGLRGAGGCSATPYRIDIDIYPDGRSSLAGRASAVWRWCCSTHPSGLNLPFTYPPLAAVLFSPFAWLQMPAASVATSLLTWLLLIASTAIVLTGFDAWPTSRLVPARRLRLRRLWLAVLNHWLRQRFGWAVSSN